MIGLPSHIRACLFDLDGVLTQTAAVHAKAWKEMFDGYLRRRADRRGEDFVEFDLHHDYDQYVDGKPRYEGVQSFLESRHIDLPPGETSDSPGPETIHGLGNRKNELVEELIQRDGVQPYEGSVAYVKAAQAAGLRRAVVSSSTNCHDILASVGILDLFEEIVDGVVAEREHLAGKPAPDTFLAAAKRLGVQQREAAVFEDALAGVQSGRAGDFGIVVGVDRVGQAQALKAHGADVVVDDLAELLERS